MVNALAPYCLVFMSLWQPKEAQLRFCRTVSRPGVPQLDALNHSVTPAKIYHPRFAAGLDSVPDRNLFIGAVAVMNHNALKLDRSAFDMDLDRTELAIVPAYFDPIVISVSVHIGFAKIYPAAIVLGV
jgi:hypothetical protein